MASNDFWKVRKGIVIKSTPADPSTPDNGSLWYNSTLNKFRKRENGVTIDLDDSGSDVHGPGASTDNAVVRWDGTTGQTTQNSTVTISDAGIVAGASIDADTNTITNIENADIKAGAAIDAAKIHDGSVSNTEYGYLDGVTSSIQTQFSNKVTGPASATDNAVVRYNLTTGKLAQDSLVTISDTGAVTGLTTLVASGSVTGASFIPTSSSIPALGIYTSFANRVTIAANSIRAAEIGESSGNGFIVLGTSSAGSSSVLSAVNDGSVAYSSSGSSNSGGNLQVFGPSHATLPNRINLRQSSTTVLSVAETTGLITIGAAASTQAHVINGSLSININADTTSRLTLGNSNSGASSFTNLILNNSGSIGSQVSINSLLSGAAASVVIASPGGTTFTRFGNTTTSKFWIVGQEASASDQFVIARGTDIAANQFLRISDTGQAEVGNSANLLTTGLIVHGEQKTFFGTNANSGINGIKAHRMENTSGSAVTLDVCTVDVSADTTTNAVGIFIRVVCANITASGAEETNVAAHVYFSGGVGVFVAGTSVLAAGVGSGLTDPTIAWSGAGDSRILQLTLNNTFTMHMIEVSAVSRVAGKVTLAAGF